MNSKTKLSRLAWKIPLVVEIFLFSKFYIRVESSNSLIPNVERRKVKITGLWGMSINIVYLWVRPKIECGCHIMEQTIVKSTENKISFAEIFARMRSNKNWFASMKQAQSQQLLLNKLFYLPNLFEFMTQITEVICLCG